MYKRQVQWAFKVILFLCGTKLTVIGEENVPKDQPVLYIANHQSYFDIVVSYSRCPGLTGYIAKDGLAKVPILSIWMKRLYCLFLNRQDIKEGMKTILKLSLIHISAAVSCQSCHLTIGSNLSFRNLFHYFINFFKCILLTHI